MKKYPAVLFPETVPVQQVLVSLVPVFQPLVYCQPVEIGEHVEEKSKPPCQEFLNHSLYQRVFPAPLGPDRERFSRLLSDLRTRGDDYAAQLASVSLASLGDVGARAPETKSSILSTLLKGHGIQNDKPDKKAMILWQARLILKLGEFYDEDQQQLNREMEEIKAREQGLIAELRKESEHSFSFTEKLFAASAGDEGLQRLRLKAWARIYALGEAAPDNCHVFITRNSDAIDRLAEEYEREHGKRPEEIMSLLLPAGATSESTAVTQLERMSGEGGEFLELFNGQLQGSSPGNDLWQGIEEWQDILEQFFPAASCGRKELKLYSFKQVAPGRLFLDSFGFDEDKELTESVEKTKSDIVIGVLS